MHIQCALNILLTRWNFHAIYDHKSMGKPLFLSHCEEYMIYFVTAFHCYDELVHVVLVPRIS